MRLECTLEAPIKVSSGVLQLPEAAWKQDCGPEKRQDLSVFLLEPWRGVDDPCRASRGRVLHRWGLLAVGQYFRRAHESTRQDGSSQSTLSRHRRVVRQEYVGLLASL